MRIITFNILPIAFELVSRWAKAAGHEIVLAVTTPGPKSRLTPSYIGVVEKAPREVDVLVSTRIRTVVTPLVRALEPDLIISFSFPYRITPELIATPKHGAVNLHPAVLPAYRGPNVMRQFYDGAPVFGATLHWTDENFDTGRILSQKSAPMPESITPESIFMTWPRLMQQAITEGTARAFAGDPGQAQNDDVASYAAPFTSEEHWLDWSEPGLVCLRKSTGLNILEPGAARAMIEGQAYKVMSIQLAPELEASAAPGTVLARGEDGLAIVVADGVVRVGVEAIEA